MRACWKRLLACCLVFVLLLAGCSTGGDPADTTASDSDSETGTGDIVDPITTLTLVENGLSNYTVVYPEGCDTTITRAARSLISKVKSYTGAKLEETDDYLKSGAVASDYEILIGNTNREETKTVAATLLSSEWTVQTVGTKLVIVGAKDNGTVNAADYFVEKILKKTEGLSAGTTAGTFRYTSDLDFTHHVAYSIQNLSIDGVSIASYKIVTPAGGDVENYLARLLRRHLSTYTGYALDLVTDAETYDYEIRIGKTARTVGTVTEGKATVTVGNGSMEILWDTDFGMTAAFSLLEDEVFSNLHSSIALTKEDSYSAKVTVQSNAEKSGEMRIMYHNVWGYVSEKDNNQISIRPDIALSIYRAYAPDILGLQECSETYRAQGTVLFDWLKQSYTEVSFTDYGGEWEPIFYRSDLFEQVDAGFACLKKSWRVYGTTWVVLRRKSDGQVFAVTNSHFGILGDSDQINDAQTLADTVSTILERYGKISVFSGGDFNCNTTSESFTLLKEAGQIPIRTLAKETTDLAPHHGSFQYNTDHDLYPLQATTSKGWSDAIDHITVSGVKPIIERYDIVNYSLANTASDHCAHFADVTLVQQTEIAEGDSNNLTHVDFSDLFA